MVLADLEARSLMPRVMVSRCEITGRAIACKLIGPTVDPIIAVEPANRSTGEDAANGIMNAHDG